jgi:hypothetical protein
MQAGCGSSQTCRSWRETRRLCGGTGMLSGRVTSSGLGRGEPAWFSVEWRMCSSSCAEQQGGWTRPLRFGTARALRKRGPCSAPKSQAVQRVARSFRSWLLGTLWWWAAVPQRDLSGVVLQGTKRCHDFLNGSRFTRPPTLQGFLGCTFPCSTRPSFGKSRGPKANLPRNITVPVQTGLEPVPSRPRLFPTSPASLAFPQSTIVVDR